MATGDPVWMNRHKANMMSQPFYITGTGPNGQVFQQPMIGMLQEIKLFRYVFPKEGLNLVLNTLNRDGAPLPNGLNTQAWAMRKALGLKPIPEYVKGPAKMPVSMENIQVVPIGIKEDVDRIIATTGTKQEAL